MFCYEFDYTTYTLHLMTNVTSSLFHRVKVGKQGLALSLLPLRTNGAPTALNGKRVLSGERCILFVPPPVNVLEWGTTLILSKLTECVLCRLGNSKFPQNILISAPGVTLSTRLVTWPESDIGCLDIGGGWSVVSGLAGAAPAAPAPEPYFYFLDTLRLRPCPGLFTTHPHTLRFYFQSEAFISLHKKKCGRNDIAECFEKFKYFQNTPNQLWRSLIDIKTCSFLAKSHLFTLTQDMLP